jgi:hypothetical protein
VVHLLLEMHNMVKEIWLFSNGQVSHRTVLKEPIPELDKNVFAEHVEALIRAGYVNEDAELITPNGIMPLKQWFDINKKGAEDGTVSNTH